MFEVYLVLAVECNNLRQTKHFLFLKAKISPIHVNFE